MKKKFLSLFALLLCCVGGWANYSSVTEGTTVTLTWDFAEFRSPNNVTNPSNYEYNELIIQGGSDNETITTSGFKVNGSTQKSSNVWTRYIQYVPEYKGTITVYAESNNASGGGDREAYITTSLMKVSSTPSVETDGIIAVSQNLQSSNTNEDKNHFSVALTKGTTYYIESYQGIKFTKIVYTYTMPAPSTPTFSPDASEPRDVGTEITLTSTAATSIKWQWGSSTPTADSWSDAQVYSASNKPVVPAYGSSSNTLYVRAINAAGNTDASATYTITTATPSITAQSIADAIYTKGTSATALSVTAAISSGSLAYQWYSCDDAEKTNPAAIDGQTSSSYTPSTATAGTAYYFCRVSNADDATKYVESDVATIRTVNEWGKSTWDLSSIEASDVSSNTDFWEEKENSGSTVYYVKAGATADVRIALENNNGLDMVQGIRFYRAGNGLQKVQTILYIGRGFCMMGAASSHVEIPAETGKYYRITYARGNTSGTYGYSISSGAIFLSGDLTYAFTSNDQRGSFVVKATATTINLACTDNNTTFSKVEEVEVLSGAWSRSSDAVLWGTAAPAIPTLTVTASDEGSTDGEYTVTYSLKEGSTDGIVTVDAATGITAISTATVGSATVVATLTSTGSYGIATETVEYTVTVNARTNTATTYTAGVAATKVLMHKGIVTSDKMTSATLANVATITDCNNNTGVQQGSTYTFSIDKDGDGTYEETGIIGIKLSGSRKFNITPEDGVTITSVKCLVRSNGESATSLKQYYDANGSAITKEDGTDITTLYPIIARTSTATDYTTIDMSAYYSYGFAFSAQVQAVFLIEYSRAAKMDVTIKETGYATLYTDFATEIPDGVEAYYGTLNTGKDKLVMHALTDYIPANTAVILHTETPGSYTFMGTSETVDAVDGNVLEGSTTETAVAANSVYTLGMDNSTYQVGMCLYSGTSVRAYSAYITASSVSSSRILSLSFDDEATSIKGVATQGSATDNSRFRKYLKDGRLVIEGIDGIFTATGVRMK